MLNVCLIISLVASLIYLFGLHRLPEGNLRSLIKTSCVAMLAVAAYLAQGPLMLITGLTLGAVGDFYLSRRWEGAFLAAISAFALSHIAYIILFWDSGAMITVMAVIAVAIVAAIAMRILMPQAGRLALPIALYIVTIGAMGAVAFGLPEAFSFASYAAFLFMASVTVLGLELFVFKGEGGQITGPFIWVTYYAAQLLFLIVFAQVALR